MGTLQVVATPIGNLEDVTLRALRTLREADLVLAEDTRHTRILLSHHEIRRRTRSLHAHNEVARIPQVLDALKAGQRVALVSDAGTPLLSDPGQRLVAAAAQDGHDVVAVPGASAVLAALSVSGLPVVPFTFLGFVPRRKKERKELLEGVRDRPETLVFFESPRRVGASLVALTELLGDRPACVARELTKIHEEVVRGSLGGLAERFQAGGRGEITIVVAGADVRASRPKSALEGHELDQEIRVLLARGQSSREIAAELASRLGLPRREVYSRAVALRRRS